MAKNSGTVGHLKPCKIKIEEHGSQGREGNGENYAKSRSRLKVSNVKELTFSIGSLFHEMGSLTEWAAFLRFK